MTTAFPKNFLFTTLEAGGVVAPVLAVARKLLAKGHFVRVMSDLASRDEVESAGAVFIPWTRAPSRPDRSRHTDYINDWDVSEPVEGLLRNIDTLMCGPALDYAQDLLEELNREAADLVVGLDLQPGVFAGCEAKRQNCVLLTQQLSLFPIPGIPPLGPGLPPAANDTERAEHAKASEELNELFNHGLPALNKARVALGLQRLSHVSDQFRIARKRLLGTSRAFDFAPPKLPEGVEYVGPQIGPVQWAEKWEAPASSDQDPRPLIAVAFSTTFQNHAGVLQRVMDAAARLPARVIVTLGGVISPSELNPPDNCTLLDAAPHDALFSKAQLVVTHGGHGTVMRAIIARRPMLILPHGRDQNDNAVRIAHRGAGLVLPNVAEIDEIEAAINRLLNESMFTRNAETLGQLVADEAENSLVVDELCALATPSSQNFAA